MELKKLNEYLYEMDTLSRVSLDYDQTLLEIVFNCLLDGEHENVDIVLRLLDPTYYHLPFTLQGDFQVLISSAEQLNTVLPSAFIEEDTRALRISYNGKLSAFYCCFTELSWSIFDESSV